MDRKSQDKELELQTKELELQTKEVKTQELKTTLIQTELDLANAVLVIQEKEAELAQLKVKTPPIKSSPPITFALTDNDADNLEGLPATPTNAGFGTKFPSNPQRGDIFLRVDMLPNKLFKWNGQKWIEIAKSTTDRYAYEEEYILYLLEKIRTKEYSMDDLSPTERDQVIGRLNYQEESKL